MKFWLIIFFFTPDGEFESQKAIQYKNKPSCVAAMKGVRPLRKNMSTQSVCVSDNHYRGIKQDPGVPYD